MIRLSPKHGVNPSVANIRCFFCQEVIHEEVWLLGRMRGIDREAPRSINDSVPPTHPCAQCAEWMREGVILISVRDGEMNKPECRDDLRRVYRTGGWVVVKNDAAERIFGLDGGVDESVGAQILTGRWAFIEDTAWSALGLPAPTKEGAE